MIEIFSNRDRKKVKLVYEQQKINFPFIHSVTTALQAGRIFANSPENPTSFFICHDFGWSEIIGSDSQFIEKLHEFIFMQEEFSCFKVRAFTPADEHVNFFSSLSQKAERCQFRLDNFKKKMSIPSGFSVETINSQNMQVVSDAFGLDFFSRNWPSKASFTRNAFGSLVRSEQTPCAVCYSCASMGEVEEIDVFTAPNFRGKGLGRLACEHFIDECRRRSRVPNWDCFTNNEGSMMLAKSLGFKKHSEPYAFFTYNRRLEG